MVTTAQNNNSRLIVDTVIRPVDPAVAFNQGDLCYWDDSAKLAKPLDSDAHAATLLGTFQDTNPVLYHAALTKASIFIQTGMLRRLKILGAEAIVDNMPVYYGDDAQTITSVAGSMTQPIGHIQLQTEEGECARTTVADEEVQVMLNPSYIFHAAA